MQQVQSIRNSCWTSLTEKGFSFHAISYGIADASGGCGILIAGLAGHSRKHRAGDSRSVNVKFFAVGEHRPCDPDEFRRQRHHDLAIGLSHRQLLVNPLRELAVRQPPLAVLHVDASRPLHQQGSQQFVAAEADSPLALASQIWS